MKKLLQFLFLKKLPESNYWNSNRDLEFSNDHPGNNKPLHFHHDALHVVDGKFLTITEHNKHLKENGKENN